MEFKGTKDRWYAVKYGWIYVLKYGPHYDSKNLLDFEGVGKEAAYYNAQLASCSLEMFESLKQARSTISRLQSSIMAHPDCTQGSEFDDYTNLAQDNIQRIEQILKKATE